MMNLETKDSEQVSEPETNEVDFVQQIVFFETKSGFVSQSLITQDMIKQIKKTKLKLSRNDVFQGVPSLARTLFDKCTRRKNEIYYFVSSQEMHVPIEDAQGSVFLSLINTQEINNNLKLIKPEIRKSISNLHLGAVKICIKADFAEMIDTPMTVALFDKRFTELKTGLLGAAQANLYCGKFIFTVYPKFGVSLEDGNLDEVLSFTYDFEKKNLLKETSKMFSITYLVAYALTNSAHSIELRNSEYVSLEDVFANVGKVESKKFEKLSPLKKNWSIDVKEFPSTSKISKPQTLTKDDLGEMSQRINYLASKIDKLSGEDD